MNLSRPLRTMGWVFFSLIWVAMEIMLIPISQMPGGSYDWDELPPLFHGAFVTLLACVGASVVCLVGSPFAAGLTNRRLKAKGRPAKAVILNASTTGTTVNDNPVVRFVLEVHTPDGQVFQAESERLMPILSLWQIRPGASVPVKYDPRSHQVALDM